MKMKINILKHFLLIITISFIFNFQSFALNNFSLGIWKFRSNSLVFGAEYNLKNQKTFYKDIYEDQWYNSLMGDFRLSTESYIWNEKLIKLNLDAGWNPNAKVERNIILPNTSQAITSEKLNFGMHLFEKLPVSLTYNYNYAHSFQTNDLTTNLEAKSSNNGLNLAIKTKIIDLNLAYNKDYGLITELRQNGRTFETGSSLFSFFTSKSLSDYDNSNLVASYNRISSQYSDGLNYINNLIYGTLISNINLTKDYDYQINNNLSYNRNEFNNLNVLINQKSNLSTRINNSTSLNFKLPYNFKFHTNYQKSLNTLDSNTLIFDNISGRIEHQLFASLHTNVEVNLTNSDHTQFNEKVSNYGFGLNYSKDIGIGRLFIDYNYRSGKETKTSEETSKNIRDEEYQFDDSKIVLLSSSNIDISTIEVTNLSRSRIYQLNSDYTIRKIGYFIELQRVPGGQISNKELTYISYITRENSSYNYNLNLNMVNVKLNLFNELVILYFGLNKNNYSNISVDNNKFLQIIDTKILGINSKYDNAIVGIEYENNNTNLMPYNAYRLNSNYSYFSTNSYSVFLMGNISRTSYKETLETYDYGNLNCKINYYPSSTSIYSFDAGYNIQKSNLYNLSYVNLNAEWERIFYNFSFIVKYESYFRFNANDNLLHNALKIKIERKI